MCYLADLQRESGLWHSYDHSDAQTRGARRPPSITTADPFFGSQPMVQNGSKVAKNGPQTVQKKGPTDYTRDRLC